MSILEKIINTYDCESSEDFIELVQYLKHENVSIDDSKELLSCTDVISESIIDDIYSSDTHFLKHDFINRYGFEKVGYTDNCLRCLAQRSIKYSLDDNLEVVVDFERKQVLLVKSVFVGNKESVSEYVIVDAVPVSVKVLDTRFLGLSTRFNITWESNLRQNLFNVDFEDYVSLSDVRNGLVESGLVLNNNRLSDTIAAMINCCVLYGFAEIKTMIDNKGVYFDEELNNLTLVKVDSSSVMMVEFQQFTDTLNKLKSMFDDKILATILKWSMLSIFCFSIKQKKYQLPFLYCLGASDTGKSTLGRIMMYVHDKYNTDNDVEGDSASTEYRYAKLLSKNCCFVMINEPYALFNSKETVQVFKSSVESLISRKTHDGVYPAFAPVMFTANDFMPEEDAIYTRIYGIMFSRQLRKTNNEWKIIYDTLRITNTENTPLRYLNVLGRFAVQYVIKNPDCLAENWMNTADNIIKELFNHFQEPCPRWLLGWAEQMNKLEDLDNIQIENIRSILIKGLSKARGQVKIIDKDYGYVKEGIIQVDNDVSKSSQFEELFWDIFNERKVEWLIPYSSNKNPRHLFLGQSFKQLINKYSDVQYTIATLSQLLEWDIKSISLNGSRKKGILISLEKFLEFVYP